MGAVRIVVTLFLVSLCASGAAGLSDFSALSKELRANDKPVPETTTASKATETAWVHEPYQAPSPLEWTLVFEDDFTGSELNSSVWTVANNTIHGHDELQVYVDDEVSLANGTYLVISTQRRDHTYKNKLYHYTSGMLDTQGKFYYTFGRWEVRAKMPSPRATGIWPAHWVKLTYAWMSCHLRCSHAAFVSCYS